LRRKKINLSSVKEGAMIRQTAIRAALAAAVLPENCTREKSLNPSCRFPEKKRIRVDQTTFFDDSQGRIASTRSTSTHACSRSHYFFRENTMLDVRFASSGGGTDFGRYLYGYDAKGVINTIQELPGDGQGGLSTGVGLNR
jgi:hypothetical protein